MSALTLDLECLVQGHFYQRHSSGEVSARLGQGGGGDTIRTNDLGRKNGRTD